MKSYIVLILLGISFGSPSIHDSYAQFFQSNSLSEELIFIDSSDSNWNSFNITREGITITLETNKVKYYSEFEVMQIKLNITNSGLIPISYTNTDNCKNEPKLELKNTTHSFFPEDNFLNPSSKQLCLTQKDESVLLPNESVNREITWKQQVPKGIYSLWASTHNVIATVPITIIEYGVLEPSIQKIHQLDLSPKKQTRLGISPQFVQCEQDLELILKTSNGQPACVKPNSVPKLINQGWGTSLPYSTPTIWTELIFSQCGGPPWKIDWIETNSEFWNYQDYGVVESGEEKIIQDYYQRFDIQLIDVTRSNDNNMSCEACSCIVGSYHLQMSLEDYQKWIILN